MEQLSRTAGLLSLRQIENLLTQRFGSSRGHAASESWDTWVSLWLDSTSGMREDCGRDAGR
jgi:hypothetical protein